MRAPGLLIMVCLLFFLGGCSAAAVAVVDNAMTSMNGDTCSFAKIFRGEAPCEDPDPKVTVVEEPLHCYRTLGVIDCYRAKDPFAKIEGRSPDDKHQVSSPSGTAITGNNALLNSKRLHADTRPTIVRRSTPLEVDEPEDETPRAQMKTGTSSPLRAEDQTEEEAVEQPMGPLKSVLPPLKS